MTRDRWWILKCDRPELEQALAATCRMALARLQPSAQGYAITTARDIFAVDVRRRGPVLEACFDASWTHAKKGVLLRKVLAKQLEPVIPRLRIQLRRRR